MENYVAGTQTPIQIYIRTYVRVDVVAVHIVFKYLYISKRIVNIHIFTACIIYTLIVI